MRALLILLVACGASESVPVEPPEPDPPSEPTDEPIAAHTVERPEWRWVGEAGEPDPAATSRRDAGGMSCTHRVDDGMSRLECRRRDAMVWYRQERTSVHAALAQHGETLLVARFGRISSGCSVYAYDIDTGLERWRIALDGLGPIEHSQYLNAVQIQRDGDQLVVFGDESEGKYIEVLDLDPHAEPRQLALWRESSGTWTAHAIGPEPSWRDYRPTAEPPEGEAHGRNFDWQGAHRGVSFEHSESVRSGAITCAFEGDADAVELRCRERGELLWGWRVADRFQPGAELLADTDRLYVVRYHPGATGCSVRAFDLQRGTELWVRSLWGAGQIAHSAYENDVRARLENERVVVFGWESGGRYLEMLSAEDGTPRGYRSFEPRATR